MRRHSCSWAAARTPHGADRRVCPADPAGRRGRQRRRRRGAGHEAGQRADRLDVPPACTRSRSASRSSGSPATRRRCRSSAPTSTSRCSRRRTSSGSVGEAVGIFNYTVLGGGLIAPEPSWVRAHISTADRPDPGSGHLQQRDLPPARGGAPRGRRARAGRRDPPRRVRRLLLPAVHRRHHASSPTTPSAWPWTSTCPATSAAPSARWTAPSCSIFESWGFTWGGHWRYTDPMHFEANAIVTAERLG